MDFIHKVRESLHRLVDSAYMGILCWLFGLLPIFYNLSSPRRFEMDIANANPLISAAIRYGGIALLLGLTLAVLLVQRAHRNSVRRSLVWMTALTFHLSLLLSTGLSAHPKLSIAAFVYPLLLVALGTVPLQSGRFDQLLQKTKIVCAVYVYGSLVAWLFFPSYAIQAEYPEGIFPFRLFGLATHANALAMVAVLFYLLEIYRPSKGFRHWVNLGSTLTIIAAAQSKTTWVSFGVALIAYLVWGDRTRRITALISGALLGLVLFVGVYPTLTGPDSAVVHVWRSNAATKGITFSGRTAIWEYTLEAWKENKLFGYGYSALWNSDMQTKFAEQYTWRPGYAHNQWFQTLGQAGIVGLAGLLLFNGAIAFRALQSAKRSHGFSVALIAILFVGGLMEVTMSTDIVSEGFFVHFVVLCYFLLYGDEAEGSIREVTRKDLSGRSA